MNYLIRHKGELSFIVMLTGWLLTLLWGDSSTALFIIQSGFEAGTVGGAADWLAVKMIFDEIKIGNVKIIPASGIIPRKQKEIAKGAGKLVAEEWLSPASLNRFLEKFDLVDGVVSWMRSFRTSDEYPAVKKKLLNALALRLQDVKVKEFLSKEVESWWSESARLKAFSKNVSREKTENVLHAIIPKAADRLTAWVTSPETSNLIRTKIEAEQGFFGKIFFDAEELTEKIVVKISAILRDIESDESHPLRQKIIGTALEAKSKWELNVEKSWIETETVKLVTGNLDSWITNALSGFEKYLQNAAENPDDRLNQFLDETWTTVEKKIQSDWREALNARGRVMIGDWLESHHHKIAGIVEENLSRLSPEQIKNQFKERTYDDMQWIRVNGAFAGFVIGLVLGTVRAMM